MATMTDLEEVELGFLEKCDSPDELTSPNFPSKVGGKPAWLDPAHLPSPDHLTCNTCQRSLHFLLQIYAPLTDDPQSYHRSIFVFMCSNDTCHHKENTSSNPFIVLRCQLPLDNPYYPIEGNLNDESSSLSRDSSLVLPSLCVVCGCLAPNRCGQCHMAKYCSQYHQMIDWKRHHKGICKKLMTGEVDVDEVLMTKNDNFLLEEFEIVTESEPATPPVKMEKEKMDEYLSYIKSDDYKKSKVNDSLSLDGLDMSSKENKFFSNFKERISLAPDQVLRFQPGGKPLSLSPNDQSLHVPPCPYCHSQRRFEFQVMPQLLYYLKLDSSPDHTSIDWATLIIYTCSSSCTAKPDNDDKSKYMEEFILKQTYD